MRYYIVDAFTDKPFGGNPAGVVLLDGDVFPNERLMLQIAAELRYSETAFVRQDSEKEFTIRYFTPMAEVELCGHATFYTHIPSALLLKNHKDAMKMAKSLNSDGLPNLVFASISGHILTFTSDGYYSIPGSR